MKHSYDHKHVLRVPLMFHMTVCSWALSIFFIDSSCVHSDDRALYDDAAEGAAIHDRQ